MVRLRQVIGSVYRVVMCHEDRLTYVPLGLTTYTCRELYTQWGGVYKLHANITLNLSLYFVISA